MMAKERTIDEAIDRTFDKVIRPLMKRNQERTGMRDVSSGEIYEKITLEKVKKYGGLSDDAQNELEYGDYELIERLRDKYPNGYYV